MVVINERGHPDKRKGMTFDLDDCLFMLVLYFRREKLYIAKIRQVFVCCIDPLVLFSCAPYGLFKHAETCSRAGSLFQ